MPADDQPPHTLRSVSSAPDNRGKRHRVLVADDNPVNREVALRMLEQLGYAADAADDGLQALAAHRNARYDLILMDCEMPHLDGFATTRQLRAEENGVRTPVLALTAHARDRREALCREAGMDGLLLKPLRPQVLREILTHWLGGNAAGIAERIAGAPDPENAPSVPDELEAVCAMFGRDFNELAALYQKDGPGRLATLRTALDSGDHALLVKIAHAMGGSSASIGATGLAELCRGLELQAKKGLSGEDASGIEPQLRAVEAEYRRVCKKLQALTAQRGG